MSRIRSILQIHNAEEEKISSLLRHLQKIQDVPSVNTELTLQDDTSWRLVIDYPLSVFDHSVTQFLAVLFGELSFMRAFGDVCFLDIELPEEVYHWFGGPKFGVEGIQEKFRVQEFPFLTAILKPSIGPDLTPDIIEKKIADAVAGGFHAVKDDEMQGDLTFAPLEARLKIAKRFPEYVPTINVDDLETFKKILRVVTQNMILVNATVMGFPLFHRFVKTSKIPFLSHLAMQGVYHPNFSPRLFAFLHRLFGADALITPIGDTDYYRASKKDEQDMVTALTMELPIKPALPLLTGGAKLTNIESIIASYERSKNPYGVVMGTQIFGGEGNPKEMAEKVVAKIREYKKK